jgi:hypothetical protein
MAEELKTLSDTSLLHGIIPASLCISHDTTLPIVSFLTKTQSISTIQSLVMLNQASLRYWSSTLKFHSSSKTVHKLCNLLYKFSPGFQKKSKLLSKFSNLLKYFDLVLLSSILCILDERDSLSLSKLPIVDLDNLLSHNVFSSISNFLFLLKLNKLENLDQPLSHVCVFMSGILILSTDARKSMLSASVCIALSIPTLLSLNKSLTFPNIHINLYVK